MAERHEHAQATSISSRAEGYFTAQLATAAPWRAQLVTTGTKWPLLERATMLALA